MPSMIGKSVISGPRSGRAALFAIGFFLLFACEEQQKQVNRFRDWQDADRTVAKGAAGRSDDGSKTGTRSSAPKKGGAIKGGTTQKSEPRMKPPTGDNELPQAYKDLLKERRQKKTEPVRAQEWLKPASLDLGKHRAGSPVKGRYEFQNPTGKEMTIQNIASSCTCQSLVLILKDRRIPVRKGLFKPILVAAGTKGVLEFQVEATDSERKVYVTLFTSDPENPQVTVVAKILGVRDFQVLKGEREVRNYQLGLMKRKEQRQIELRVKSTDGKPFTVVGHEPFPDGLELEAIKDAKNDAVWWLRGAFRVPPKAGANAGGKVLFKTDRGLGFEFDVSAMVLAPIRVLPKTVQSLSGVPQGESRNAIWTLVGIDPETRLEAVKGWFELDPNSKAKLGGRVSAKDFEIVMQVQEDGRQLRVEVKTPGSLPPGLVMGNVLVKFKDENLAPLSLRLMVQVRRARH